MNWVAEAKTSRRGQGGIGPGRGAPQQGPSRVPKAAAEGQSKARPAPQQQRQDYHSSQDVERQLQRQRQQQVQGGEGASSQEEGEEEGGVRASGRGPKASPSSQPLRWQPLELVGPGEGASGGGQLAEGRCGGGGK